MRTLIKFCTKTFFLFLFLTSVFLFIIPILGISNANKITWDETTGTILNSYVKVIERKKGTSYCPTVSYKYQVDALIYENESTYANAGCKLTSNSAEKILNNYPEGKTIKLYFNKEDHGNSVIDKQQVGWSDYFLVSVTIFLSFFSLYLLLSKRVMDYIFILVGKKEDDNT